MARSIATRKGDDGSTSLLFGQRVPKDHPQIEAVGAFDELNAAIGQAKASCGDAGRRSELERLQTSLVALMGELACAEVDAERYAASSFQKLESDDLARLDAAVAAIEAQNVSFDGWATPGANLHAAIEAQNVSFDGWATPGANLHAAALDLARTAARRAERRLLGLPATGRTVRPLVRQYVNRLSDLLWLMARQAGSG